MKTYPAVDKVRIRDDADLRRILHGHPGSHYVYLLCLPPDSALLVPFYVGIGKGLRIFSHEDEARDMSVSGRKVDRIRGIWSMGGELIRVIDGIHEAEPWAREEELINKFGLEKDGSGVLTNEQRYSRSYVEDGVELRKYADSGNELPNNFRRRHDRLIVGPRSPKSSSSVYGKICAVLQCHPGVTGAELVELLLDTDFTENKSAYTSTGNVSRPWLAKYIDGGFYEKNRYIQTES